MLEVWLPLLCFASLAWGWYHVMRLREHATAHASRICERHGLQMLDDSVALHRLRVQRHHGGWHVLREYRFDTSRGGNDRQTASITLLGDRIVRASVPRREPPERAVTIPIPVPYHMPHPRSTPPSPEARDDNVVSITRARQHTLH